MLSLVTGSSGLLGECLRARLRERGERVRLLDLVPPAGRGPDDAEELVLADVADAAATEEAARGAEVIYHLAAAQRMKPQFSSWSEDRIFEKNLTGVRNVLGAAERCGVPRVVFTSSSAVYGIPRSVPCGEGHPTSPLGAYGRSKLLAEEICREAVNRGLDVTVLRPMSLFGPRMTGIFVMLFEWVRSGRPVYMLGRGSNRVQTVSAWDVADACLLARERPEAAGGVFNLGSDPDTVPSVLETVQALIDHAGTGSRIIHIPALLLRTAARALQLLGQSPIVPEHYILADRNFILDTRSARVRLGWRPAYDNTSMMIEAYDGYVNAGEESRQPIHPLVRLLNRLTPSGRRRTEGS